MFRNLILSVILGIAVLGFIGFEDVYAETKTFAPSKDASLFDSSAGDSAAGIGSDLLICCARDSGDKNRRALIAFDLSTIPSNAIIDSVELKLTKSIAACGRNGDTCPPTQTVNLHKVTKDWGEGTSDQLDGFKVFGTTPTANDATWKHSFYSTTLWTNLGGDFTTTVSASATIFTATSATDATSTFSSAGLISDVQGWVKDGSNYGWLLKNNDETGTLTLYGFASKDHSTAASRPVLTVTYTIPDTEDPVVTAPADISKTASSTHTADGGTAVTFDDPTATDNVGVTVGPTCDYFSGDKFPIGTTTVTCSAEDAEGNEGTDTFDVTITLTLEVFCSENYGTWESNTCTLTQDSTLSNVLIINSNESVEIPNLITFDAQGPLAIKGKVTNSGIFKISADVAVDNTTGEIENHSLLQIDRTLSLRGGGTLFSDSVIVNNGGLRVITDSLLDNSGWLYNNNQIIITSGELLNNYEIHNDGVIQTRVGTITNENEINNNEGSAILLERSIVDNNSVINNAGLLRLSPDSTLNNNDRIYDVCGTFMGTIPTTGNDIVYLCDADNDGIVDDIDTLPGVFSNDFDDGDFTTGTITSGNNALTISDKPSDDGVDIVATGNASVQLCGSIAETTLSAGDEISVRCGSVTINVVSGPVDVSFVSDDGSIGTATLSTDDDVTFEGTEFTFTNNGSADVELIVNGQTIILVEGQTITDSDGDGIPDTEDTCPGFDDTLDVDNDGIPDACDFVPLAIITSDISLGDAPLDVSFTCVNDNADENLPLTYSWNFGDGASDTTQNPTHTFTDGGDFTATCTVTDVDGDVDSASVEIFVNDPIVSVTIDIKPESDKNQINTKSKGVIPTALFSTSFFDATMIDLSSVIFGAGPATESHDKIHIEDVNGDGVDDVILHFNTQDSGIVKGDIEACIAGSLTDGTQFEACDDISAK
jgi:hypothetical protein